MIDKYGRVKVCDFGATKIIAKQKKTENDEEDTGGSIPYMAPEVRLKQIFRA